MIRIIKKTNKDLLQWAIDLVVSNMKIYNKTGLLRHAKTKSISNPANIFIVSFKEKENGEKDNGKGDVPIGFVTLRIFSDVLYIYEIHVEAEFRNRRVGTRLLDFIKEEYKETVRVFVLYVYKANIKAIKFYEANGFVVNKKAKCDHKYFEMIFQDN